MEVNDIYSLDEFIRENDTEGKVKKAIIDCLVKNNFGIKKGSYLDERRYPIPTIEYENMGDSRNYLCLVFWKWYVGFYWETE